MGGSNISSSLQLSGSCLEEVVAAGEQSSTQPNNSGCVSDDEYVEMLFGREKRFGFWRNNPLVSGQRIKCARLDSIAWILKTRAVLGFRLQTAYLSITYFDQFISKRSIDIEKSWVIRLLSVACLSLAAKMEEQLVPALSEFEIEGYYFESRVIQRMELLVLNTLEWRLVSITPFAFIHYFIRKIHKEEESPPQRDNVSLSRIVELIVPLMREINLMQYRPSVIAIAATLVTLDQRLTRSALEYKINSISCWGFLQIEDVFACYQQMQAWEGEKDRAPNGGPENPSVSSSTSKRKRLSFDKNYGMPNEKRIC